MEQINAENDRIEAISKIASKEAEDKAHLEQEIADPAFTTSPFGESPCSDASKLKKLKCYSGKSDKVKPKW